MGRQNSFTTSAAANNKRKPKGAQKIDQILEAWEPTICRITRTKKKEEEKRAVDQVSNLFFWHFCSICICTVQVNFNSLA
jgi:hypothetical protein